MYPEKEYTDPELDRRLEGLLREMGLGATIDAFSLGSVEQWEDILSTGLASSD